MTTTGGTEHDGECGTCRCDEVSDLYTEMFELQDEVRALRAVLGWETKIEPVASGSPTESSERKSA